MSFFKSKFCFAILIATAAVPAAIAQNSDFRLEEIVVTAEKKEASLQDTPIAVTALDASLLERSNIEDSLDLQFAVPNLMIGQNSNITIRGVGQNVLGGGADPAVSSSFNSMPISPAGENYDLERIEVLRGPQGTLFGRNTTGGVINTISAKATDTFGANLSVQVANFGSVRAKGAINLPISDSISQRFAFNSVKRDGYTRNIFNNTDIDGRDEISIRSTTHFEFGDTADATLVLQYFDEDSDRQSAVKVACQPDPLIGCAVNTGDTIGYPADVFGIVDGPLFSVGALRFNRFGANPNPDDYRRVSIDVDPSYKLGETFAALEFNIDIGESLTLTSATAYAESDLNQFRDFDLAAAPSAFNVTPFTPADPGDPSRGLLTYFFDGELQARSDYSPTQRNLFDLEEFSQEFRILSSYEGSFNFLAGVSYTKLESEFLGISYIPGLHNNLGLLGVQASSGFNNEFDTESESKAIFGEIYLDINDNLTLTAGLRYTEDDKESVGGFSLLSPVFNFESGEGNWEEVTGKLNLNWNVDLGFTDETSVYATLSRGYKGGGINPGNLTNATFDPEFVDAIEFGAKNQLFDYRMQLNLAAFSYDYQDFQVGGLINGAAVNANAEEVDVAGLEIESVYLITERLLLNANVAFLDTEIVDSLPLVNTSLGTATSFEDVRGNNLPNAPETSFNIGAQYTFDIGADMDLSARLDYYWQDDYQGREFDNYTYESWERADFYLNLSQSDGKWQFEAFVKNLTDDDGITGGNAESGLIGNFRKLRLLDPRTYGIEITYNW